MKFAFDLDETLVKGDVVRVAAKQLIAEGKLDRIYTGRDVTSWDLIGLPKPLVERTYKLWQDKQHAVYNKTLIEGVIYFLHYLRHNNHEIAILTARHKNIHKDTHEYVTYTFNKLVNEVVCVEGGPTSSKMPDLAKLDPDFYFDDNVQFCEESRLLGIKTYLVSNEHTPWNHKIVHNDITRIKNVSFMNHSEI